MRARRANCPKPNGPTQPRPASGRDYLPQQQSQPTKGRRIRWIEPGQPVAQQQQVQVVKVQPVPSVNWQKVGSTAASTTITAARAVGVVSNVLASTTGVLFNVLDRVFDTPEPEVTAPQQKSVQPQPQLIITARPQPQVIQQPREEIRVDLSHIKQLKRDPQLQTVNRWQQAISIQSASRARIDGD